jgi:proteic killer suppression protein
LTVSLSEIIFPDVIRTFRDKALRAFFQANDPRGMSVPNVPRIRRILLALETATQPEQLNLPGYYFYGLQSVRRWSVRVTGNWRITFGWDGVDAIDVALEDYH